MQDEVAQLAIGRPAVAVPIQRKVESAMVLAAPKPPPAPLPGLPGDPGGDDPPPEMTLGGRRVPVSRPRIRSADDERELPVATYEYFADRDPLQRAVMNRMLAGVSTRKFARVGEPVGEAVEQAASAKNKSTVSEMFIERRPGPRLRS